MKRFSNFGNLNPTTFNSFTYYSLTLKVEILQSVRWMNVTLFVQKVIKKIKTQCQSDLTWKTRVWNIKIDWKYVFFAGTADSWTF